jgi:hypothetical protein
MEENKMLEEEIDRFMEGSMTNEEKETFLARLAKDPELVKEVELQRSIIMAIRRERLDEIIQKEEERIKKQRTIRKLVISIGSFAVAASIFGIIYLSYLNNCANLADRYYVAFTYTPIPSRGGENLQMTKADSIFLNALHELETGDKKLAIIQLEKLNNSTFEMLASSEQAVKWYLSLAYLKNGQRGKARIILQEIVSKPNSEFKIKAEKLLRDL